MEGNTQLQTSSVTRNEVFEAATGHTKHAVHTIENERCMNAERKRKGKKEGRKEERKEGGKKGRKEEKKERRNKERKERRKSIKFTGEEPKV